MKFVAGEGSLAAEKLTKMRLFQIMMMMIVLIVAFSWRTINYSKSIDCKVPADCDFSIEGDSYSLNLVDLSENNFSYSMKTMDLLQVEIVEGSGLVKQESDNIIILSESNSILLNVLRNGDVTKIAISR